MPGRHFNSGMGRGRGMRLRLIDPIILLSLHQEPAHGYSLMEALNKYGLVQIDISVLYRTLHQMEDMGWVTSFQEQESSQGPPRRVYHITADGENVLAQYISDLEMRKDAMQRIIGDYQEHIKGNHTD